jgi:hypothetical protein
MINSSWIDLYNFNLILNNFLVQQAVGLDNPVRYTINRKKKRYLIIRASRIPEIAEFPHRRLLYRIKDFYLYYPQFHSEIVQVNLLLNETLVHKIVGLALPQSESKEIVPAKKI